MLILASFSYGNKDSFQHLLSSAMSTSLWEGWVKHETYSLYTLEKHMYNCAGARGYVGLDGCYQTIFHSFFIPGPGGKKPTPTWAPVK